MNTDPRGVKRFHCNDCDCESYEYNSVKGPECFYCSCPPTKHAKSDSNESTAEVIPLQNGSYTEETPVINESTLSSTGRLSLHCNKTISKKFEYASALPKRFPSDVEKAMAENKLTVKLRNKAVKCIAECCLSESIPKSSIDAVADVAVQKWRPLHSSHGHRSKALSVQIKKMMSELKIARSIRQQGLSKSCLEKYLKDMTEECSKTATSMEKLKFLQSQVRTNRRNEAGEVTAEQHILKYPSLKFTELILWEFTEISIVPETTMEWRLRNFITKMYEYLKLDANCSDIDIKTVQVLEALPVSLDPRKQTSDDTKYILQVFEGQSATAVTVPSKSEPPRLVAIGNSKQPGLVLTCYVDGIPMLSTHSAIYATMFLMATYWVFNIKFPVQAMPSLLLLGAVMLQEGLPRSELQKCRSVINLLSRLNL